MKTATLEVHGFESAVAATRMQDKNDSIQDILNGRRQRHIGVRVGRKKGAMVPLRSGQDNALTGFGKKPPQTRENGAWRRFRRKNI